ncbi:unnamed protein product [Rangifer tarandus platyrhynchus]|uniref:Uncharacterized protein n=1 Tax=Rangifer tarandus platyrhynchus TaxID=3082113 RepID=A0ABN8YA45_RANTA|nr:unnamed protein product [Rangifer tarandus platyrhynchus]
MGVGPRGCTVTNSFRFCLSRPPRGRGEKLAVCDPEGDARQRPTHPVPASRPPEGDARQRPTHPVLHLGLPGSRTLRNKCVRLKPHSAAFLLAEAWTGTAAASVVMICGDDREGGPQMLHPGARGASLPV